ncbi:ABC transporter ATP-binding protein [Ancylobacter radicis]|uniref:ATP-binding cassette domain-containing protein n=1 Tax=Ancylobacter radicis TaxID=2836179 RepID=A0ABS5R3W2_9HYPH|nr:ATP-binding cassette domain-containing protein [Ancylobacter radicis]MBS9476358.1 ATP-binding cassette domain-containing protein [Ancylobacter radicis]
MPSEAVPALVLADVELRFPGLEQPALALASLTIAPGETVALVGPSGCGKTSLINILTGLEVPQRGSVDWSGTDITRLSQGARDRWRARHIGLVMQEFHLFPGLSALENVLLPQRLAHFRLTDGAKPEAERLLRRVGIDRLDQPVETMSRGQMQRVAVARALAARPGVIVADEPTASLDADAGESVAALLLELTHEAGATLIVATHDPHLVPRLHRLLRLESGRLKD